MTATHYDVLGVDPRAKVTSVRIAYRKLARRYHPDVNADPLAHEQMARINVAFEVLSDPVRRMEYDSSIGLDAREREAVQTTESRADSVQTTVFRRLRAHKTPVYAADYDPQGRLVTCSFDNELVYWDKTYRDVVDSDRFDGGSVSSMAITTQGTVVAAGATEQSLNGWRREHGRILSWKSQPGQWCTSVAVSPDGNFVAAGSNDAAARIHSGIDGRKLHTCQGHTDAVTAVCWTPDSTELATGSGDATVRFWSPRTGRCRTTIQQVRSLVTAITFSPNRQWMAVAAVDLSIRIFRMADLSLAKAFFGHEKPIESLAFHPKSWLLSSGSRDGTVGLWNIRQGIGHGRIDASHQAVTKVLFAPDGSHLTAAGLDKTVRVWRIASARRAANVSP